MFLLLLPVLLALFAVLAWRYGADSRDGQDWCPQPGARMPPSAAQYRRPATPSGDLLAAWRWVRRGGSPLADFNRTQVALWERYLRAQRPWEAERLHWVDTPDGSRLEGSRLDARGRGGQGSGGRGSGGR
ncbi:MAG: hypothetical protein ACRDXE_07805 [Acidimicrobiales bacterium]